jgi:hypothetical protein
MVKPHRLFSLFTILPAFLLLPLESQVQKKSAAPVKKAPASKKAPAAPAPKPPVASAKKPPSGQAKPGAAPKSGAKATARRGRSRGRTQVARRPSRPAQKAPTPDRIREIQESLRTKGYDLAPTGAWDKQSEAAMKKFQQDQNLEGAGKLTALSLIALGLGSKHESAPAIPPRPIPVPEKD